MSRNRLLVVLLVLIISLFTTPITFANAIDDNSSNEYNISARDNQEESFTVNPLPFYNITNTESAEVSYNNERVYFNNTDNLHDDSILGFSETTPDNVIYYPDFDLDYDEAISTKFVNSLSDVTGWTSGGTDWDIWENIDGGIHARYDSISSNEYPLRNCKQSIQGYPATSTYDGSNDWTWYLYFKVDYDDNADYFRLGIREYNGGGNSDWFDFMDYSKNEWHYVEYKPLVSMADNERLDFNAQLDDGEYAEIWMLWIACLKDSTDSNLDELFNTTDYDDYRESFRDITDWVDIASDTLSTDGDIVSIGLSGAAWGWQGGIYTNIPSYSIGDEFYIEWRVKKDTTTESLRVYLYGHTLDDVAGTGYTLESDFYITTDDIWETHKVYVKLVNDLESIRFLFRVADTYVFECDYFRIMPYNKQGWQHDGSTIEGAYTDTNVDWDTSTVASDGDICTFTMIKDATGGDNWGSFYFETDTTATVADLENTYYQFVEIYWRLVSIDSGSIVINTRLDGKKLETASGVSAGSGWQTTRFNIAAGSSSSGSPYVGFYYATSTLNDEAVIEIDYAKVYSIANYTVGGSDIGINDVMYVDSNNNLIMDNAGGCEYSWIQNDVVIAVAKATYPVWNLTCSQDTSGVRLRELTDGNVWHDLGDTRGVITSNTLRTFRVYNWADAVSNITISAIEYFSYPNSTLRLDVTQYKNHKFEFMLEKTDIGYMNIMTGSDYTNSSNSLYWYFNNDTITYGNHILDVSGYDILRFEVDLKYTVNQYKITIKDYNNSRIESLILYDGFIKSASRFYLSLIEYQNIAYLYYLSGDFEFRTNWDYTEISKDDDVLISLNQMSHEYGELITDTDVYYNMFVPSFQFYRTEIGVIDFTDYLYSPSGAEETFNITQTLDFFYPNGSIRYKVICFISYHDDFIDTNLNLFGRIIIYEYINNEEITLYSSDGETETPTWFPHDIDVRAKFGVWRTQENTLGVKFTDTNTLFNEETDISEFTVFTTNDKLENFQCNITIRYELHKYLTFNDYTLITLDAMEYSYNLIDGVSEPHFSTTWWEGIPIIGAIIDGFIWVGKAIINGFGIIIDGLGAIFSGIIGGAVVLLSPVIDGVTAAVTAVAAGIWGLFSGILDAIGTAIGNVASTIWGFFESVIENIIDNLDDLILGLIDWIVEALELFIPIIIDWLSPIIEAILGLMIDMLNWIGSVFGIPTLGTDIANLITMFIDVTTSVFEFFGNLILISVSILAEVAYYITRYGGTAIMIITIYIVMDISIVAMEMDMEQVKDKFSSYLGVLNQIFEIIFKIFNAVLQFIGGIIP